MKTLLDICVELDCQPGDLIRRVSEIELEELTIARARNKILQRRNPDSPEILPTEVYVVDLSKE